jgi:hypothetical protein
VLGLGKEEREKPKSSRQRRNLIGAFWFDD